MTRYSCKYPNGEVKQSDHLPEPPLNGKWIFEGYSYGMNKYTLKVPPVEIVFKTEFGIWRYMSDKIPSKNDLQKSIVGNNMRKQNECEGVENYDKSYDVNAYWMSSWETHPHLPHDMSIAGRW